jgi:hypothetical protein
MTLPPEIAASSRDVQEHFLKMIAAGQNERFASMCALQQPPGTKGSDRAFMEGRLSGNWLDDLPKRQATWMVKEARAAGINPTGKFYLSGIADKRGHLDPEAWVGSVDDVKRVARARNLTVQGAVSIEGSPSPRKEVALNPTIEGELAQRERAKNPKLSPAEAAEKVRQKHAPRWKRKSSGPGT